MSDILAYALGEVIVYVASNGADASNENCGNPREQGNMHFAVGPKRGTKQIAQPRRQPVTAGNIVDDDFQWPRGREAHRGLDHHCDENDEEHPAIWSDELSD